jgi:hypothetical protein
MAGMEPKTLTRIRHRRVLGSVAVAVAGLAAVTGCGSGSGSSASKPSAGATVAPPKTVRPASSKYDPKVDPANYTTSITNPYFTLTPGMVQISKGVKDGVPESHTMTVTKQTKLIAGVKTRVISDIVTTTGGALVEKVADWYAQDRQGNVWYFGESTADYAKGVVVSTKGSWETGVDGAKPGIIMPAKPKPGPAFYTEYRPGVAEDRAQVLDANAAIKVPLGTFHNVVVIRDTNPLDPTLVSHKWYAKGVGVIRTKRVGSSHTENSLRVK